MCGRITPHMGRIPIPTLIKAILWKLLVCTHNNIHVHDEAATYHITFAIISCRKRAEWCHRCGMLRLHVCPTNQPACQPSIIIIQLGVRTNLCRGQSRAEQTRAKQRTMQAQLPILQMTSTTQSEGRWIDYDWVWEAADTTKKSLSHERDATILSWPTMMGH